MHPFVRLTVSLAIVVSVAASGQAAEKKSTFKCGVADVSCLVDAIETSNANGLENTIILGAGVYTIDPAQHPSVLPNGLHSTGSLTIRGAGADATIIERASGSEPFRILLFEGSLTLEDLTIRGGDATAGGGGGGGIAGQGTLTVRKCRIASNRSLGGGGVSASGTVEVRDSVIELNESTGRGGGLSVGGNVTISGSTIARNTASREGGGITLGGSLTVLESAIVGNHTNLFGGGIFESGFASLTISNSTMAGNSAAFGGAIQTGIPDAMAPCCGGDMTIENSSISGNRGTAGDGGVDGPFLTGPKLVTLRGTILSGNTRPSAGPAFQFDCGGSLSITSLGHNLIGRCPRLTPVESDLSGDPLLGDLVDGGAAGHAHLPLLSGSPAIDAGDDTLCAPTDQLGLRRPADGDGDLVRRCDIGAIEFYPVVNNSLRLESLGGVYLAPSGDPATDAVAPGGRYRVDARFTNVSGQSLCGMSAAVLTLQGASGLGGVVLKPNGASAGGAGAVVLASEAGTSDDLEPLGQATFSFLIGLRQKEPFTFFVNLQGEPFGPSCR